MTRVVLTDEQLERLADLVAARLHNPPPSPATGKPVTAATLARLLDVDRSYIYEHAADLGAVRLGHGPKAPLRFDIDRARRSLTPVNQPDPVRQPTHVRPRRRAAAGYTASGAPLLPVHGDRQTQW